MFKWISDFQEASKETKLFALNWFIYALVIVLTTLYCYGRLEFVRSGPKNPSLETPKKV